jgi:hypothetical protein
MPERSAKLYHVAGGKVYNTFRYTLANRSRRPATVVFSLRQLNGAALELSPNPIPLAPGETLAGQFDISLPEARSAELVSHFTISTATVPGNENDDIPMTFLSPAPRSTP